MYQKFAPAVSLALSALALAVASFDKVDGAARVILFAVLALIAISSITWLLSDTAAGVWVRMKLPFLADFELEEGLQFEVRNSDNEERPTLCLSLRNLSDADRFSGDVRLEADDAGIASGGLNRQWRPALFEDRGREVTVGRFRRILIPLLTCSPSEGVVRLLFRNSQGNSAASQASLAEGRPVNLTLRLELHRLPRGFPVPFERTYNIMIEAAVNQFRLTVNGSPLALENVSSLRAANA